MLRFEGVEKKRFVILNEVKEFEFGRIVVRSFVIRISRGENTGNLLR